MIFCGYEFENVVGKNQILMRQSRRQAEVLAAVQLEGAASIADLAAQLSVSDESIRRDIKPLVSEGLLVKVHGGVVLPERLQEPPMQRRMQVNKLAKEAIAVLAVQRVQSGDSLMLDTGSTTIYVARALLQKIQSCCDNQLG